MPRCSSTIRATRCAKSTPRPACGSRFWRLRPAGRSAIRHRNAITNYGLDRTAVVTLDGSLTFVQAPGTGPLLISVGRIVFTADVLGTNEDGLPVTGPPTGILFESGINYGSILGACQALAS